MRTASDCHREPIPTVARLSGGRALAWGLSAVLAAVISVWLSAQTVPPAFPGYSTAPPQQLPFPSTNAPPLTLPAGAGALPPAHGPIATWPSEAIFQDPPILPDQPPVANGALPAGQPAEAESFEPFELAQTMAQVGDQYILRGELVGDANLLLYPMLMELTRQPSLSPEEREQQRTAVLAQREPLVHQLLQQAIDRKLMYLEFLREVPTNMDEKKLEETKREQTKRVNDVFRTQLAKMVTQVYASKPENFAKLAQQNNQLFRIALLMKAADIDSQDDPRLDRLLRQNNSSLPLQMQAYKERTFGQLTVQRKLNVHIEVTHEQLLNYYREHVSEFQVPLRARWEQMSVLFKRVPEKWVAGQMIADMGNQVRFGGAPFEVVAQKRSQEKHAALGGYHDWTAYNDLSMSLPIRDYVFSLPTSELNKLGEILEDEDGLHILRVLERQDAHLRPFSEAQLEITTKLKTEAQNKAYREYLADLRARTPIWTIYDGPLTADQPRRRLQR
ncbi:MAG: peptidylprolyl isomerase [Pirellulaceae bacterium]